MKITIDRTRDVVEFHGDDSPWAWCSRCGGRCDTCSCGLPPCCAHLGPQATARCNDCGHDEPVEGMIMSNIKEERA